LTKDRQSLQICYEAGPCGYGVQRQAPKLGYRCDVVALALIPRKVGDKVKTDRRDAMMLAQTLRAGQLTAVWVPDEPAFLIECRCIGGAALRNLLCSNNLLRSKEVPRCKRSVAQNSSNLQP
jgi:hypothetical protein